MRLFSISAVLVASLLLRGAGASGQEPADNGRKPVFALDDPPLDAYGPARYTYPTDPQFREGDFDLRHFAVFVDGDDVVFEVTVGSPIRLPDLSRRKSDTPLELVNGVYLQNIDIYLDTDRSPGAGYDSCIPGRRIGFWGGRTWESVVVITPQPAAVRAVITGALGSAANHVFVPDNVVSRGETIIARVPAKSLGGFPKPSWGYSVQLSGANWDSNNDAGDRLPGETDAQTMPVAMKAQPFAFGGAPPKCHVHPRIIDIILPPGFEQRAVLGSFDPSRGTFAHVPFVYADGLDPASAMPSKPRAPSAATAGVGDFGSVALPDALRAHPVSDTATRVTGASLELSVAEITGDVVTLLGPTSGIAPLRVGRVLGPEGLPVGKVVVGRVFEGHATASVLEGSGKIGRGAKVVFESTEP